MPVKLFNTLNNIVVKIKAKDGSIIDVELSEDLPAPEDAYGFKVVRINSRKDSSESDNKTL